MPCRRRSRSDQKPAAPPELSPAFSCLDIQTHGDRPAHPQCRTLHNSAFCCIFNLSVLFRAILHMIGRRGAGAAARAFRIAHVPLPFLNPLPTATFIAPNAPYGHIFFTQRWPQSLNSFSTSTFPAAGDTIYALSTAQGRAGIAVVRISGPSCIDVSAPFPIFPTTLS